MKRKGVFFSLAIALGIIFAAALPAFASEASATPVTQNYVYVNPLYEGTVDPSALVPKAPDAWTMGQVTQVERFTTVEDAGLYMRQQMKARVENVSFRYVCNAGTVLPLDDILSVAVAHTGVPDEGDYLTYQYQGYALSYSWSSNGETETYTLHYTFTYYDDAAKETVVSRTLEGVLESLDLEGRSEYGKILAIYDYIADNTTYDFTNLNDNEYMLKYTAYAALIDHTAVCQGYANLLYRMLLTAGIDCRIVSGMGNGGPHAWNIVRIGDLYYNVDVTWDSERSAHNYLLKADDTFENHTRGFAHGIDYAGDAFYADYPMAQADYESIHWTLENGLLTISGEGDVPGDFLRRLGNDIPSIYAIRVEPGILAIGDNAFANLPNVSTVWLPDTVRSIGNQAFMYCSSLMEIHLPMRMASIGRAAFARCSALESVTVPEGILKISAYAFLGCASIRTITFPSTLQSIEEGAFNGCWTPTGLSCFCDVYFGGTKAEWQSIYKDSKDKNNEGITFSGYALHCMKETEKKAKVFSASRIYVADTYAACASVYAGDTDTVVLVAVFDRDGRFSGLRVEELTAGEVVEITETIEGSESAAFLAVDPGTLKPLCESQETDPLPASPTGTY